ncbi:MAG: type II toxin-antitoxin system RelE/ParE family toxin [Gemmatimonadota bacterium]
MDERRTIEWHGDVLEQLRGFPPSARWMFGRAIFKAELGARHAAASPLKGMLRGVIEVAVDDRGNTYRLYYTLKCPDYLYVLFAHMKKSKRGERIPRHEVELIRRRFKRPMRACQEQQEESR